MKQIITVFVLLFPWEHAVNAADPAVRNVVLLYADDWRHDTLGCAGHPIVKTPHLDALAKDGHRFTHNCVTTSICGVSRATMLTGQWMSRHGNRAFEMFKTPWSETLPGRMRAAGYHVGHVGKWHCGKFPAKEFDFARAYSGKHFLTDGTGREVHVTIKNQTDAQEFLTQRPADKPFFLTVAFFATHAEDANPKQYLPQRESEKLYADVTIPTPKTATDDHFKRLPPFLANAKNEGRNRYNWRFDTPEKYQQFMKAYYRLATEVDTACGKIIAELQKQNLLANTLILFTTDNGYFHAEHGLADKWYPYEESIRVPLIVRDPRMAAGSRGKTSDEFTLNVDLAPTILAAVGEKIPPGMQGQDFAPLYLSAKKPEWRTEFFYEHATIKNKEFIPSSEALVRKTQKYIRWPEFDHEELFDLQNDPGEEVNLASQPKQADRLTEMRKRFAELKEAAK
jgi:arylsulfatase